MLILVGLATIVLLTAVTGYFVAQEFAYVAADRSRLQPHEFPTALRNQLRAWVCDQVSQRYAACHQVDNFLPGRFRFPQMAWYPVGCTGIPQRLARFERVANQRIGTIDRGK